MRPVSTWCILMLVWCTVPLGISQGRFRPGPGPWMLMWWSLDWWPGSTTMAIWHWWLRSGIIPTRTEPMSTILLFIFRRLIEWFTRIILVICKLILILISVITTVHWLPVITVIKFIIAFMFIVYLSRLIIIVQSSPCRSRLSWTSTMAMAYWVVHSSKIYTKLTNFLAKKPTKLTD